MRSILTSSERLQLLINDILDLAVTEAGALALDVGKVDICDLVASVAAMIEGPAQDRDLRFRVDCPEDVGCLEGDAIRLKQALFNLTNNAVRFTPAGGLLTIGVTGTAESVTVNVTDTGIGIPEAELTEVFERFKKGSNAIAGQGVGLGLSLVREVVELPGGKGDRKDRRRGG